MNTQPQTRSPPSRTVPIHCTENWKRRKVLEQSPVYRSLAGRGWIKYCIFAAGPRPAHHQGGFRPIQFFQRPQIQPPRATIQNSSPSIRPGAQTPTAVYQTNQHIMMVNHLPMPYPMPQGPQYCIPQYRHSGPPYVGPPQQYPVQPPGPGPFYPGPGPGEFPNAYGTPFYPSQPVYQSAPIIVPTQQQQPPPAKREKKTIRIRDPNQGGKDITEEIMSGGGSRNPTPPIVRPTSTPTPPQQVPSQVPEPVPTAFGAVESSQPSGSTPGTTAPASKQEEKPKPDPVLKPPSPVLRPEPTGEKNDQTGQMSEAPISVETPPELPRALSPALATPVAAVAAAAATAVTVSNKALPAAEPEDKCELASSREEAMPTPSATGCPEPAAPPAAEEPGAEVCTEPSSAVASPGDAPVTVTAGPGLSDDTSSTRAAGAEPVAEVAQAEAAVLTVELEPTEAPPAGVESTPSLSSAPLAAPSPPPTPPPTPPPPAPPLSIAAGTTTTPSPSPLPSPSALPVVQGDLEGEESTRTTLSKEVKDTEKKEETEADGQLEESQEALSVNLSKTPIPAQTAVTAPKTWKKPKDRTQATEEVTEAETEPKEEEEPSGDKVLESDQEKMSHGLQAEREPLELKAVKPVEENGEQETELVRNGAESVSEGEGTDANSGCTESSGEGPVYQYKPEQWKPLDPEGKKQYDREFLLDIQFMPACIQKPEGLPPISDVVLDKVRGEPIKQVNQPKLPLRTLDPRILPRGPDFTPAFADFGRQAPGGRNVSGSACKVQSTPGLPSLARCGPPACPLLVSPHPPLRNLPIGLLNVGPRRSQPGQRREPRKIITVCVKEDVHLKKAENAWKPSLKRENQTEDPENVKTQELFRKVRSILNKLTPQMFNQLMKQVTDLTVDTEERLKGVIDLVFEKAIDEPSFSVAYANMCRCLVTLKVPMADKPGSTVNFRKLLLNRCQKEFEKDKADDDVFEKKQKELEAATTPEEKTRLHDELEEAKDKARRRSIGNIKFIGELFKLKMLTEAIMHDCVVKLLKNHDEESLECLCRLLTTIGKDLDFEKAKPRMDQYFNQMEKIVKERKTSSRIRFMLQDVIDLRLCNWVSRRADQGPKTIEQIHKEAKIEEQEEQRKVQQLMTKDKRRPGVPRVDEGGWNTVQGAKNSRVLDPTKFLKITKPTIDEKIQLVPKAQLGSWGKGSSGGAKASEMDSLRPSATSLNRFSALQPPVSPVSASSASSELESRRALTSRGSTGREKNDKALPPSLSRPNTFLRGSSSKELLLDNQAQEEQRREMLETVKQLTGGMEMDRNSTEAERNKAKESAAKPEAPPAPVQEKPSLSEEEIERKCKSIIDEFLHINDFKEAMQCVEELSAQNLLPVFVRVGVESTLERSQITRDHMGQLLHQLVQSGKLSKQDFFKGFSETLEMADDMAIDIPHIWLYLAELVTPVLKEGGISMRELTQEFSKPLLPVGRAGVLLAEILHLLCKQMSHKKVGALWRESGLSWKEYLPEGEDVHTFLMEQKLEFTESDCSSSSEALSEKELSAEELNKQLEKLIVEDKANDEQIFDWVEANLDESQMSSPTFLRALMTAVCKAAIIADSSSFRVDTAVIKQRVPILLKYLDSDTEKELQALYALQASIVKLDQPPNLLRMFFDCLYDEEVISEDAFYKWESSKDPAEQNGKGVALKSVTAFFTWLREAEEESEDN
ncbi:eukaryotic translation initiation factor 4 gamma 3 isoform X7 [Catharus ustulatus]|uniref:eukaryotic translation initiation factor 4 gamma 3 isoform X7 n=1 Tax=Catharus ustulatus TaxID=91951 RepID=UPI00140E84F7|nr:eukaryotic translation initiation factor 4 gamma 3 isoform X7 [Catharus ustulatus]XP_032935666.1 eukaryotic translation initiation factor 4 gamma 3 isoform X7 [Catharus ustulatus]XP_032935667.1 eukaryotic translation initiation factor 4 gamma 3 isoform X7 [Catharus ustulatus]XP_032935668.1 eukaryotic translation initiation factor 4 gamma 3 isoform X7 [Catharus ustulatus]XP_032935673.1 eukaryotic translation initiation factor 4 gamma 3 isoform X7 [Catharus ustulatus]XP_032935675.1 eukaryotic